MAKQIMFIHYFDSKIQPGILTNDGIVIGGFDGKEYLQDDCVVFQEYKEWVPIGEDIVGGLATIQRIQGVINSIPKERWEDFFQLPTHELVAWRILGEINMRS